MVNPNAGGAGEGNNKGKGKMVFESDSRTSMDGIPLLPPIYYQKYERLAESLHKQLLEIKAWKERCVKEGKEKEEEESPAPESTVEEEEEERMKKIRSEISALKLGDSWELQGEDMKVVERECLMCLSLEKTVAFLPCAHLALCHDCNVLHQKLGMNDCPTCRTPIQKRITVCFPPPTR